MTYVVCKLLNDISGKSRIPLRWVIISLIGYHGIVYDHFKLDIKIDDTDRKTAFRWPQEWPDRWGMLEYRVVWPEEERVFPAEIRILASPCPSNTPIQVFLEKNGESNIPQYLGEFSLPGRNSWGVPIEEHMFDKKDTITILFRPKNYDNNCQPVFSRWTKSSRLLTTSVQLKYFDLRLPVIHVDERGRFRRGVLVAQITDPRY